jgi:pimeloyl-ACP methyl ester carboxylesterase
VPPPEPPATPTTAADDDRSLPGAHGTHPTRSARSAVLARRMPARALRVFGGATLVLAAVACTGDDSDDSGDPGGATGSIDWGPCELEDEVVDESVADELECATVAVPLDHDDPEGEGEQIDLELVRLPAAGSRDGALLVNPGGPGESGFEYVAGQPIADIREILRLESFDIVGFDPRGVARSGEIGCELEEVDTEIDTELGTEEAEGDTADADAGAEGGDAFEECLAAFDDALPHFSTEAAARDMDLIREGLGDDTISFLGHSYGTYLGGTYATLFPDRVRAMVLDSAYDPAGDSVADQYLDSVRGVEEAFKNWAGECQADDTCAFHSDNVPADWDALRAQLDDEPLTSEEGIEVDGDLVQGATFQALYVPDEWPALSEALAEARAGDPTGLLELSGVIPPEDEDDPDIDEGPLDVGDAPEDIVGIPDEELELLSLVDPLVVINCASGISLPVPDDPDAVIDRMDVVGPRFNEFREPDDFVDECEILGLPAVEPTPLDSDTDAPILVVGGLGDPATPYRGSVRLAARLGENTELITWAGDGHAQLFSSPCLIDAAADVLADAELPEPGTTCDP